MPNHYCFLGIRTCGFCLLRTVLLLFCLSVLRPTRADVLQGDPELILLVINARKNNIQRISTWRGEATIDREIKAAGAVLFRSRSRATFAYDRDSDRTRWNRFFEEEYHRSEIGEFVPAPANQTHMNAMRTPDTLYRFDPGFERDGHWENTLVIWPKESRQVDTSSYDFDPMWFFTQKGYDFDDRLQHRYREADNPALSPSSVERQGDLVVWVINGKEALNHFTIDLSKGGNLTRYLGEEESAREICQWEYEKHGKVWIPKKYMYEYTTTEAPAGGAENSTQRVVFSKNIVNEPLDDSEFSLKRLGVKAGTRVTDQARGLAYKYADAGEVSTDDLSEVSIEEMEVIALRAENTSATAATVRVAASQNAFGTHSSTHTEKATPVSFAGEDSARGRTHWLLAAAGLLCFVALGGVLFKTSRKSRG